MDTKFIITLVLLSFTGLFSQQEDKKGLLNNTLTIQLSSETNTCYYSDDKIVLYIEIENNGLFPIKVNKNMPVSIKETGERGVIKINICHNNKYYEYAFLDGKQAMLKNRRLFQNKTLKINDIINFRQLALKAEVEAITNISKANIDNKDFGEYQLQAIYIMNTNDTIISNWVTINYLE